MSKPVFLLIESLTDARPFEVCSDLVRLPSVLLSLLFCPGFELDDIPEATEPIELPIYPMVPEALPMMPPGASSFFFLSRSWKVGTDAPVC